MKRAFLILSLAALAAACAHQPRVPGDDLARRIDELSHACMGRALHAEGLLAPDAPERERRGLAFKNYYESFLDAKEEGFYVDCLRRQYGVPWLHADYRHARHWLAAVRKEQRDNEPLAGPDKKISDVTEAFEKKDDKTMLRRLTITFASGAKTTVEETFPTDADRAKSAP